MTRCKNCHRRAWLPWNHWLPPSRYDVAGGWVCTKAEENADG